MMRLPLISMSKSLPAINSRFLYQGRSFLEILLWLGSVSRRKKREISPMVRVYPNKEVNAWLLNLHVFVVNSEWESTWGRSGWIIYHRQGHWRCFHKILCWNWGMCTCSDSLLGSFAPAKSQRLASQPNFCDFKLCACCWTTPMDSPLVLSAKHH